MRQRPAAGCDRTRSWWSRRVSLLRGVGVSSHLAAQYAAPVSMQTLAVLLTRRPAWTTTRLAGTSGVPGGGSGWSTRVRWRDANAWSPSRIPGVPTILGPTSGYLVGFVLAAWLTGGRSRERNWDRRVHTALLAMLAGQALIYVCGLSGLARFVPVEDFPPGLRHAVHHWRCHQDRYRRAGAPGLPVPRSSISASSRIRAASESEQRLPRIGQTSCVVSAPEDSAGLDIGRARKPRPYVLRTTARMSQAGAGLLTPTDELKTRRS